MFNNKMTQDAVASAFDESETKLLESVSAKLPDFGVMQDEISASLLSSLNAKIIIPLEFTNSGYQVSTELIS